EFPLLVVPAQNGPPAAGAGVPRAGAVAENFDDFMVIGHNLSKGRVRPGRMPCAPTRVEGRQSLKELLTFAARCQILLRRHLLSEAPMLVLDGARGEGGGQILRTALALSLVTGRP